MIAFFFGGPCCVPFRSRCRDSGICERPVEFKTSESTFKEISGLLAEANEEKKSFAFYAFFQRVSTPTRSSSVIGARSSGASERSKSPILDEEIQYTWRSSYPKSDASRSSPEKAAKKNLFEKSQLQKPDKSTSELRVGFKNKSMHAIRQEPTRLYFINKEGK